MKNRIIAILIIACYFNFPLLGQCNDSLALILNYDFEQLVDENDPPINAAQFKKAANWYQATIGTIDYYNLETYNTNDSAPPNGTQSYVGGHFRVQLNGEVGAFYTEYIASCLIKNLQPGEEYHLRIHVGNHLTNNSIGLNGDVIILGSNDCDYPISGTKCIEDSYMEIGRESIKLENGEWNQLCIPISIDQEYSSVIIGMSCTSENAIQTQGIPAQYFLFDEVCLQKGACNVISTYAKDYKIEAGIEVFPNPSKGNLNITSIYEKGLDLELYSIQGELIRDIKSTSEINLYNIPKGFYILRIIDKENILSASKRIIIY